MDEIQALAEKWARERGNTDAFGGSRALEYDAAVEAFKAGYEAAEVRMGAS